MSGPAANKVVEKIPFSIIVFSIVSGTLLLYLIPLQVLIPLPSWFSSPFTGDSPTVLGNLAVLLILSFCVGFLSYFLDALIVGNKGINHIISSTLKGSESSQPKNKKTEGENTEEMENKRKEEALNGFLFLKWLRKNDYASFIDFLTIQGTLVDAVIVASEISLFADLAISCLYGTPLALNGLWRSSGFATWVICIFPRFFYSILLLGIAAALFCGSLLYNSGFFKGYYADSMDGLRVTFEAYQDSRKKTQATPMPARVERKLATGHTEGHVSGQT
jgi:hypothetical protein